MLCRIQHGSGTGGARKTIMTFLDSTTPLPYITTSWRLPHKSIASFLPMFPPHTHALNPACPLILFPIVRLMCLTRSTRTRTRRTKRFLVRGQGSNFAMLRNKEATGGTLGSEVTALGTLPHHTPLPPLFNSDHSLHSPTPHAIILSRPIFFLSFSNSFEF